MRRLFGTAIATAALFAAAVSGASAAPGCPGNMLGDSGGFGSLVQAARDSGDSGRERGAAISSAGGFGAAVRASCQH